jgi:hypothetical protein
MDDLFNDFGEPDMTQSSASGDAFNDSLNFVKKLWGQMGVPGMSMPSMPGMSVPGMSAMPLPSMSLEDLDKRIQELKTVETWLNVNMTMLRNTIQALEVQRATIATLHSLSSTMAKTMQDMSSPETNPFTSAASAYSSAAPATQAEDSQDQEPEEISPLIAQSAAWWQGVQEQFKQALGTALEKSAENYEVAKSASEKVVKTATKTTSPKATASARKPVRKPAAPAKARSKAKTAGKV